MVKNLQNWSRTAANNVLANTGFTWDEGQLPSTVNNSARAMMADLKEVFDYARSSQAWVLTNNASATNAWAMTAYYTPYNASGDTAALTAGQLYWGLAPTTVTSTLTLAVNGGTAKPVLYNNAALASGIITSGDPMSLYYDGTSFHITLLNRINTPLTVLLAPDGSSSAPAFSFAADTNTGIYRAAVDRLRIVCGGTDLVEYDKTSSYIQHNVATYLADGTVGAPALAFAIDQNTGIYRVGSDTLGIATGGILQVRVDTATITTTLVLTGPDGTASAPAFSFSGDTNTGIYRIGADTLGLATAGAEVARVSSTGAVGIGATSPGATLHVKGATGNMGSGPGGAYIVAILEDPSGTAGQNKWGFTTRLAENTLALADLYGGGTPVNRLQINSAGAFRFNAYGAGALTTDASGNITATSDEREKDISGEFTCGLEEILRLRPITYRWKIETGRDRNRYAGFSAQNVKQAIPEAVGIMPGTGMLTLMDRPIIAAIVNALHTLNERIQRLENAG